jgi:prophage regulatory protein
MGQLTPRRRKGDSGVNMKLLSFADLRPLKGVSYSKVHLGRLEKRGLFPKRLTLGGGRVAWPEHEIDDWIRGRIAARDEALRARG